MKFNSALFYSLLAIGSSMVADDVNAWAEKQENLERWFEVEVILFKQLGNKALLKEQFPDDISASTLPNYQQSFDLFSPYLQPSLARIKGFAPLCGDKDEQHLFLESLQSVSPPFPEQIKEIEQVAIFNMPDFNQESETLEINNVDEVANETTQESLKVLESNLQNNKDNSLIENVESDVIQDTFEAPVAVSKDNIQPNEVLAKSETETTVFEFDLQKEELAKAIFSTKEFCVISQQEMEGLLDEQQLANFNIDSFNVDALPSRLNASGLHKNDSPYLIANESLLLKDISQRLRWSKEFKPLLHFGWRQVGIKLPKKATPLKLFAGDHIEHSYQQALTDYQLEIEQAREIEENLLAQLALAQTSAQMNNQTPFQKSSSDENLSFTDENIGSNDNTVLEINELALKVEQRQQVLEQLFSRIEYINKDQIDETTVNDLVNDLVNNMGQESLEDLLTSSEPELALDEQANSISGIPNKPLQPWSLDGFLKVYLDGRYLFITADFNIFNQDDIKIETEEGETNKQVKLINFSQNRRVITGEIHYFDHPYIGMVVQIRRFDPTKPKDEQITQAIK